jgi:hypothetical protein
LTEGAAVNLKGVYKGLGVSFALTMGKVIRKLGISPSYEDKIIARPLLSSTLAGLILLMTTGAVYLGISLLYQCVKGDDRGR